MRKMKMNLLTQQTVMLWLSVARTLTTAGKQIKLKPDYFIGTLVLEYPQQYTFSL
jgi:hypothetical protein